MTTNDLLRPACDAGWRIEGRVRAVAGTLVLVGLGLSRLDERWLWLVVFVGANLLQSGLTGWCLLSNLLALRGRRKPSGA